MARLEEENHEKVCPCGKGTVTWTFYSPTAMYQRGDYGPTSLNCDVCSQEWTLRRGGELRHKGDQAKAEAALKKVYETDGALQRDVLRPIVRLLHERATARGRTAAAWYEALHPVMPDSVGIGVDEFKKRRGRHPLEEWLAGAVTVHNAAALATALGLSVPLAERLEAQEAARAALNAARAAVRHF